MDYALAVGLAQMRRGCKVAIEWLPLIETLEHHSPEDALNGPADVTAVGIPNGHWLGFLLL